ncbi:MAG: hypothetical protein AAF950_04790 [Pseudomonadota bacterium]
MKYISARLFSVVAAIAATSLPASSQGLFEPAEGDFYVSAFVGGFFPDDNVGGIDLDDLNIDLDNDVYFGGAIGTSLPFKSLGFLQPRIEAEVSYTEVDLDIDGVVGGPAIDPFVPSDLDVDVIFVQGNAYADLKFGDDPILIPYIGGGLGVAIADALGESETEFATNTSIGVTLPINKLDLYTEGRYKRIWGDGPDFDAFAWTAGLRIRF